MEAKNVGYNYDNSRKVLRGINIQKMRGSRYPFRGTCKRS